MISFIEALDHIKANTSALDVIHIKTSKALGSYLACDIYAPLDLPPFDNSAVDGFAVCVEHIRPNQSNSVENTIRALGQDIYGLKAQSCAKIMTGAPVPMNADAVIMKEDAHYEDSRVSFTRMPVVGAHIRKRGEDVKKGQLVASRGKRLNPQLIGALLGLGLDEVSVFKKPRVIIICTGDELVEAPQELKHGEVYFLVGAMLKSLAQALGLEDVQVMRVGDSEDLITHNLRQACDADLVLITGGMSKGEYDFVRPALANIGVSEIFYQGYWRPGKPLYFGRLNNTCFFGLPGNPVACFVGFRVFVQAWLGALFKTDDFGELRSAELINEFTKHRDFAFFARAQVNRSSKLKIIAGQGSHEIFSLSQSNALCYLPAGVSRFSAGSLVEYWEI